MLLQAEPDIKQNLFYFFSKSGDNQNEINILLFTLASQTFLESLEENKELEDRLTELEEKVEKTCITDDEMRVLVKAVEKEREEREELERLGPIGVAIKKHRKNL